MRYEPRRRRGGRCRVREHYIGNKIHLQNLRQRKRAMQKIIAKGKFPISYSFSGQKQTKITILASLG